MNCANKALLVVMVLATLGLWGCAQRPGAGAGSARIRDLESRTAKLEEDYRAAVVARDQFRKKLASAEEQRARLAEQVEQLQAVVKERDELKQQVTVRAAERDALHAQLTQLGKDLQTLAGRIESATATLATPPVTSAAAVVPGGKS
jgi:outer membrane murein-binding lipoprotein Lpp